MANIGRGLGKFAEGMAQGYSKAKENQRQQEMHDMQMQRFKDEKAMNDEIKKIGEFKATIAEGFVVVGPDGNKMTYADANMAAEAAGGTPGAEVLRKLVVGGKTYDHPDEAQAAVESMNSPLAKTRQAAQIALKYNRPDVHAAHMAAYKVGVDANRADMMDQVNQARLAGNPDLALEAYNKRLPNGMTAKVVPAADGSLSLEVMKNGKPVGQGQTFKTAEDFFTAAETMVSKTPENSLEIWKAHQGIKVQQQQLGIQQQSADTQERAANAGIKKTEAEVAQMPQEMALKARSVGAQETGAQASLTSAGATAMNAQTNLQQFQAPTIISGTNAENGTVLSSHRKVKNPDGTWRVEVTPGLAVPGMQPPSMAREFAPPKAGALDNMLGGAPAPLTIDWSKVPPKQGALAPATRADAAVNPRRVSGLVIPAK